MHHFKYVLLAGAVALSLVGCTASQQASIENTLATPAGQVFCVIQKDGGGQIVAGLVNASVDAATGSSAAPITAIGTAVGYNYINNLCTQAAAKVGGTSTGAVPAPAAPVQSIAITPPPAQAIPAP